MLVMGPAGSGKSTFCDVMRLHCEACKRTVHCVNLDPAAEVFRYPVSVDVRNLITLDEVMQELKYGPNGGLLYCMQYIQQNLDWLEEQIGDYDEDYLIIDCPGQIELYTSSNCLRLIIEEIIRWNYNVCGVFLLDSQFALDASKFVGGTLMCLSAMLQIQLPHVNVLTKMDILKRSRAVSEDELERFLDADVDFLLYKLHSSTPSRFYKLNEAIGTLIDDYRYVSFVPLDITDEESIALVLAHIDNSIQYGEDLEPKDPLDAAE